MIHMENPCCSGVNLEEVFTTDLASTPVHVAKWGFLGESWPFFRPNFVNMEQYKTDMSVDEVRYSSCLNFVWNQSCVIIQTCT